MTERSFHTPCELGAIRTKSERLEALWTGWASFLANEATDPIIFQLTDPEQGKINRSDIDTMVAVYRCLRGASHRDPTKTMRWPEAHSVYKASLRFEQTEALEALE